MSITINGATNTISASGTVTVPALTLGGAITGGGQNVSGLGTLACGATTVTGTLSATGITSVTDTTDATSTTAASLKTAGGLGVAKKLYVGDSVYATTSTGLIVQPTTATANAHIRCSNTGGILLFGLDDSTGAGFGTAGNYGTVIYRPAATGFAISRTTTKDFEISSAGVVSIPTTTDSSSTTTGALVVSGGVGIAKKLYVGDNIVMAAGYVEGSEMTAPAAPAANGFRIFAEDNGAGKTRLMVQFATGAAQQLAIEP